MRREFQILYLSPASPKGALSKRVRSNPFCDFGGTCLTGGAVTSVERLYRRLPPRRGGGNRGKNPRSVFRSRPGAARSGTRHWKRSRRVRLAVYAPPRPEVHPRPTRYNPTYIAPVARHPRTTIIIIIIIINSNNTLGNNIIYWRRYTRLQDAAGEWTFFLSSE